MYETDPVTGKRIYTLKKESAAGEGEEAAPKPNQSAHPARFSPDDKYSKQRILIKKRHGMLLTQKPRETL